MALCLFFLNANFLQEIFIHLFTLTGGCDWRRSYGSRHCPGCCFNWSQSHTGRHQSAGEAVVFFHSWELNKHLVSRFLTRAMRASLRASSVWQRKSLPRMLREEKSLLTGDLTFACESISETSLLGQFVPTSMCHFTNIVVLIAHIMSFSNTLFVNFYKILSPHQLSVKHAHRHDSGRCHPDC